MSKYIDKEQLLKTLNSQALDYYNALINKIIIDMPTVDDAKASNGKWILGKSECIYFCSRCSYAAHPREVDEWKYCPICGTRMDGDKEWK